MPISYLIIIGVLIKTMVSQPLEFHGLISRLTAAWKRGEGNENLFVYPWEDLFDRPLEEVRAGFLKKLNAGLSVGRSNQVLWRRI